MLNYKIKILSLQSHSISTYLKYVVIISLISFSIFKLTYPYPNVSPDSYTYLRTALNGSTLTLWPIGYSEFLKIISFFPLKGEIVVVIQYASLISSYSYLLATLKSPLQLPDYIITTLFIIFAFNPLVLQLANFIGSDALFTTISIIWLTQLLCIKIRPQFSISILHAIILLIAFTLRYNALWYPIVSIIIIITSSKPIKFKLIVISLFIIIPSTFVLRNCFYYKKLIGVPIYSAFGGWQMASNGLNAYAYAPYKGIEEVPNEFREIHSLSNRHLEKIKQFDKRPDTLITTYYLWDSHSPLRQYLLYKHRKLNNKYPITYKEWAALSPLYMSYGIYLIKSYPSAYAKHFLYPNFIYFFVPSVEYLGIYNMGKNYFDEPLKSWLNYPQIKIDNTNNNEKIESIFIMSILVGYFNILFSISIITSLLYFKDDKKTVKIFSIAGLIFFSNLLFSVTASGIVLRYQVFSFTLTLTFTTIIIFLLFNESFKKKILNC